MPSSMIEIANVGDQGNGGPYFLIIRSTFIMYFVKRTSNLLIITWSFEVIVLLIYFFDDQQFFQ